MDTNPNQYSNILKAINGTSANTPDPATMAPQTGGLTMAQQAENYDTFSKLMREGVYLPDLIKRLDDMETKIKTLESQPRHDTNAELLAVMEAAVKSNQEVKTSRQKVADAKTMIINEMCMKDPRYRQALEDYKTTVNRVYIQTRESNGLATERTDSCEEEQTPRGADIPAVCNHAEGGIPHQAGISPNEEI